MSAPWFPFFTADWIVGVTSLSAAERGVYVSLIARIYDCEGPIKHDDVRLARECGLPIRNFRRALAGLVETGKLTLSDGMIFNERAKNELTERTNRSLTASQSANSRWKKHKEKQQTLDTSALPPQCEGNATRAPVLQSQSQTRANALVKNAGATLASENDFDLFWTIWPNKVGKPAAQKAFARVAGELDAISSGVQRYIRDKPADRSWLNPATFLNQRRWEDQPASVSIIPLNRQQNPEKSVHAAAKKLCEDVASGAVTFEPIPPSIGELLALNRERERENRTRLLPQGGS